MTFPLVVFVLCLIASGLCAALLARAYLRTRRRFLLWCALSFVFIALNNALVVTDILVPGPSLGVYRQSALLIGLAALIYGFLSEVE